MIRVLFDTNIVFDVLLKREPWLAEAAALWQAVDAGQLAAWLSASAMTDIFYVAKRLTDRARARQSAQICLNAFNIAPIDRAVLECAQLLVGQDYEDNVQIACAQINRLDAIVTRDPRHFIDASVKIWSPAECLAHLAR